MKNTRFFLVTFIGPTNFRGARVKIRDLRHRKTKVISYNYEFRDIIDMAGHYLKSLGIDCHIQGENEDKGYLLGTNDFATELV